MQCNLEQDGPGRLVCRRCGRPQKSGKRPEHVVRTCRAGEPRPPRHDGLNCIHIGKQLRREGCTGCQGNVRVLIYACAVKGETKLLDCRSCEQYKTNPPGPTAA